MDARLTGFLAVALLVGGGWLAWCGRRDPDYGSAYEHAGGVLLVAGLALLGAALARSGLHPG